jgi:hypothetical protein
MYGSERFRRRITRLPKTHGEAGAAERIDLARAGFAGCLTILPEAMVDDLFEYFHDKNAPLLQSNDTLGQYSNRMGSIIDLFLSNYDHETDLVSREDWEFVRETIDVFAVDMDMDTVNYVMSIIVEKGAL